MFAAVLCCSCPFGGALKVQTSLALLLHPLQGRYHIALLACTITPGLLYHSKACIPWPGPRPLNFFGHVPNYSACTLGCDHTHTHTSALSDARQVVLAACTPAVAFAVLCQTHVCAGLDCSVAAVPVLLCALSAVGQARLVRAAAPWQQSVLLLVGLCLWVVCTA